MNAQTRAVVIGATSGIGRELVLRLAKEGWTVCATGRRQELLHELRNGPDGGRIHTHCFDAADLAGLEQHLHTVGRILGGLDLFVISAGTGFLNATLDPGPELETLNTNVQAFTLLCGWAFRHFAERGSGQLAAITSVGGLVAGADGPAYSASKAYQILYLESLRALAKTKRLPTVITEIRPGSVDTAMMKGEGHFWISSARDAADLAYEAIMKRKKLQYVSRRWAAIGTLLRLKSLFS